MPEPAKIPIVHWLGIALALLPWLASMYAFWWLDASGTWTADTAHRGKLSVMLMGSGMLITFFLLSRVAKGR